MEDLLTLGMNCVNPFEPPCMDLKVAKEKWGDRICLWGNIDLVKTLPYGTVEDVEAEVKQRNYGIIAKSIDAEVFIIDSGFHWLNVKYRY